jgi:putative solute:sodium symporter small subunit
VAAASPPTDPLAPLGAQGDGRHVGALTGQRRRCCPRQETPRGTAPSEQEDHPMDEKARREYWRRNLRLMAVLLTIWALVGFGAGILFADLLNNIDFFGFPLGFWFAQQGSIITFVILIAVYVWRMDALDKEFGIDEYEEEVHHS